MDPGQVVWLPGSGFDDNSICEEYFGYYYGCGEEPYMGGVFIYCCPF